MVFRGPFRFDFQQLPNGDLVWNCSMVLLKYFEDLGPKFWRGKKVIELGSGSADLGFGVSLLGADVLCTEMPGHTMDILNRSIEEREQKHERPNGGSIRSRPLLWGEEGWNENPIEEKFDFLINADLMYDTAVHKMLLWTWRKICSEETTIYNMFVNRVYSWEFFVHLDDSKCFDIVQIEDFDPLDLEDIHLHKFRLAKPGKSDASAPVSNVVVAAEAADAGKTTLNGMSEQGSVHKVCEDGTNAAANQEGVTCDVVKQEDTTSATTEQQNSSNGQEDLISDAVNHEGSTSGAAKNEDPTSEITEPRGGAVHHEGVTDRAREQQDSINDTTKQKEVSSCTEKQDAGNSTEKCEDAKTAETVTTIEEDQDVSLFELMEQFLGVTAEKLRTWVHICLAVLILIASLLIAQAYSNGDTMMVALHSGFFLLVLALSASINWVIYEAQRLEKQK
eukprot:GEMP01021600.1.p1 GENE.GEMP01021600.1~~GEMP01021600.1.p1  ORF type:complete len:449 (+),score=100.58 GEMP01021600.1:19-1365(+)